MRVSPSEAGRGVESSMLRGEVVDDWCTRSLGAETHYEEVVPCPYGREVS